MRKMKAALFAWTVPDQQAADQLKGKVDNIIFEGFAPKE